MRNLVSSTLDQEFTAWNPESKTALNYHTWSETDNDSVCFYFTLFLIYLHFFILNVIFSLS